MDSFSSFLSQNLALVKTRWPEVAKAIETSAEVPAGLAGGGPERTLVVEGLHLSSSYDRRREAQLQAALVPTGSTAAWVYGMGLGDLPRVLLERNDLHFLSVVLLNPAVARQSLSYFDHRDWLQDRRVKLLTSSTEDEVFFPFAAVPPALKLADDTAARLRDLIALELSTPYIRGKHAAKREILAERLEQNFSYVKHDGDVAELFYCQNNDIAYVAAAGPTLSDHYQRLRNRSLETPLIAVDAALKPLLAAGVVPDVVVTVDSHHEVVPKFFEGLQATVLQGISLVYFPVVATTVLQQWPGRRFCAYADHGIYRESAVHYPRAFLYSSGSVIHPAVDIAVKMGMKHVVLLGADFSYPYGRTHVEGCVTASSPTGSGNGHLVLNGRGERVQTLPNLKGYLRDLERYVAAHPEVRFLNGSLEGAAIKGTLPLAEEA